MRKNMKRTAALAMALGMAVTGSMAGYAAVDPADVIETESVESVDASGLAGTKTELIGTIDVTSLSVTLPLKAGFNIDPGKYDATKLDVQIGSNQSTNYKITNNSAVPVWVYISSVSTGARLDNSTTGLKTDMALKNATADLTGDRTVMLAIKDATETLPDNPDAKAAFWLGTTANPGADGKYLLNTATNGKIEPKTGADGVVMNLKVYGLTKNGWQQGDKFAVTPTFMVSTTDPTV